MHTRLSEKFGFDVSTISNAYAGYYKDQSSLFACASGGAASALSEKIIEEDGVVIGVCYTDDFKSAVFAYAETKEELIKLRSSKYIYAEKKIYNGKKWVSVFEEVERLLNSGKKVLFIGLGCEVGALIKILEKHNVNRTLLYTIDLICHGPTFPEIQKQYVERLEKKFDSKVNSFSVRYKKRGWEPPYIHAEFDNGKVFEELFYHSDFGFAFKKYSRLSCYQCQFKGDMHYSDLTVGDFWGCKKGMDSYNPMGVSIIFCKTDKGQQMMNMLKLHDNFSVFPADVMFALQNNTNYYRRRIQNKEQYQQFEKDLKSHGLHYAVVNNKGYKQYKKGLFKDRVKRLLPENIIKILKQIKSSF